MAGSNMNGREIPERAKIAELLAELMPPLPPDENQPLAAGFVPQSPGLEASHPIFDSPGLALEDVDLDALPAAAQVPIAPLPLPVPPAMPARPSDPETKLPPTVSFSRAELQRITASQSKAELKLPPVSSSKAELQLPAISPSKAELQLPAISPAKEEPPVASPTKVEMPKVPITPVVPVHFALAADEAEMQAVEKPAPPPELALEPASSFLQKYNWRNTREEKKPAPIPVALSKPVTQPNVPTADLIPMGNVTTAGYFTLMNWRNRPDQVRHPIRDPLAGLEKETITLAKGVPLFGYGPTGGAAWTVATVMALAAWE